MPAEGGSDKGGNGGGWRVVKCARDVRAGRVTNVIRVTKAAKKAMVAKMARVAFPFCK